MSRRDRPAVADWWRQSGARELRELLNEWDPTGVMRWNRRGPTSTTAIWLNGIIVAPDSAPRPGFEEVVSVDEGAGAFAAVGLGDRRHRG